MVEQGEKMLQTMMLIIDGCLLSSDKLYVYLGWYKQWICFIKATGVFFIWKIACFLFTFEYILHLIKTHEHHNKIYTFGDKKLNKSSSEFVVFSFFAWVQCFLKYINVNNWINPNIFFDTT